LYDTGEHVINDFPTTNNDNELTITHLARTSGNILQINNNGEVSSVIKKVKEIPKPKNENEKKKYKKEMTVKRPIISANKMEPWVDKFKDVVDEAYNLYQSGQNEEKSETLQLIVGRSTVQIWHQINKDDSPNKGEPFLEYIWTNRIPVQQERSQTKLRIEKFECAPDDKSNEIKDFYLKVYWYESNKEYSETEKYSKKTKEEDSNDIEQNLKKINKNKEKVKVTKDIIKEEDIEINDIEQKIREINENKEIDEIKKKEMKQKIIKDCVMVKRYEKVIQRKDIIKFCAVRHACKALGHFNKRYINKEFVDNYIKVRNVSYLNDFNLNFICF
jgi:hypothetical protein